MHKNINNDDVQYEALKAHQDKLKNNDNCKDPSVFSVGSEVSVQWEDRGPWINGFTE